MSWQERQEVKKGDYGETIVDRYLREEGFIPYYPVSKDKPHPIDRFVSSPDKKDIFVADVKTKAKRKYYPDTGFDYADYESYIYIRKKYGMNVFIFFVDEYLEELYGNFLQELKQEKEIHYKGKRIEYPKIETNKNGRKEIYFPLENMKRHIREINSKDIEALKDISNRNYKY